MLDVPVSEKAQDEPCVPALIGQRVIDYANARPDDLQVPEALALTVRRHTLCLRVVGIQNARGPDIELHTGRQGSLRILPPALPQVPLDRKKRRTTIEARMLNEILMLRQLFAPPYRSSECRSHLPSSAAASYVLSQNASSSALGDSAFRTSS